VLVDWSDVELLEHAAVVNAIYVTRRPAATCLSRFAFDVAMRRSPSDRVAS
jgi:hypothetical protein